MEIHLEENELNLLNVTVREPQVLFLPVQLQGWGFEGKPYPLDDEEVRAEVIALKKLMQTKMFKQIEAKNEKGDVILKPDGRPLTRHVWSEWRGKLNQRCISRILHILKHYEKPLAVMPWAEPMATLRGKLLNEPLQIPAMEEGDPPAPAPGGAVPSADPAPATQVSGELPALG